MVTLNKSRLVKDFGILQGDYRIPSGQRGSSYIKATATGAAIKQAIRNFNLIEPNIRILQYAIMPDHLHILLFVERQTEEILGRIIAKFKVEVNKLAGEDMVFAKGFNDQILKNSRSLDTLYRYIRDNPHRLAVRKAHPEFFRRINTLRIGEISYQCYGNLQLLDCPFREQVVIHRANSPQKQKTDRELWLYTAANGGVLVSPFISSAEKAIRAEAEKYGGRFILILNDPMEERYKPTGHDFALCESGRLLIISANIPGPLSRQTCLAMNNLAQALCMHSRQSSKQQQKPFLSQP